MGSHIVRLLTLLCYAEHLDAINFELQLDSGNGLISSICCRWCGCMHNFAQRSVCFPPLWSSFHNNLFVVFAAFSSFFIVFHLNRWWFFLLLLFFKISVNYGKNYKLCVCVFVCFAQSLFLLRRMQEQRDKNLIINGRKKMFQRPLTAQTAGNVDMNFTGAVAHDVVAVSISFRMVLCFFSLHPETIILINFSFA